MDPEGLRLAVAWLGFRSALPLGAAVVGVALVRRRRTTAFSWGRWFTSVGACIAAALLFFGLLNVALDPFSMRAQASGALATDAIERYLVAWGLHIGVYVGTIVGVTVGWFRSVPTRGGRKLLTLAADALPG